MNIVLLGHTGFVGRNVAEVLTENGIDYISTSRREGVDLRDPIQAIAFFEASQPDFIINCAAHVGSLNYVTQHAADVVLDNSRMILSMYEAIAKVCPKAIVINPIANCAYPAQTEIFSEEDWWNGHLHRSVLSYGSTRRLMWAVGESFQMQYGITSISLLVPNMYGPFDSTDPNKAHALNALVSKFVKAKRNDQKEIEVWGTGYAIREWLYAKDFGQLVLEIIRVPDRLGLAEPLNVAQEFGLSVRELVAVIKSAFNYKGEIKWDDTKPDGAPRKVMDDRRFRKVFPDFEFTPLLKGVGNTIQYYESIFPY
jgi:GDP-L-fucose synthase